jgi:hypothetical protein
MESKFVEVPATKKSLGKRKLICGVGVNDSINMTNIKVDGVSYVSPFYEVWVGVISRCYDPVVQSRQPSYKGCSICDEWLLFSNFKKWMAAQEWKGMQLDKDIIKPGNKIYSPEFCAFISSGLNKLLTNCKSSRGSLPVGVVWCKRELMYRANVRSDGIRKSLGYFDSPDDAAIAYNKAKHDILIKESMRQPDDRLKKGLRLHAIAYLEGKVK